MIPLVSVSPTSQCHVRRGNNPPEGATVRAAAVVSASNPAREEEEVLDLREHAVFALKSRHPQLREQAFFRLAPHDHPRVIDLRGEALLRPAHHTAAFHGAGRPDPARFMDALRRGSGFTQWRVARPGRPGVP